MNRRRWVVGAALVAAVAMSIPMSIPMAADGSPAGGAYPVRAAAPGEEPDKVVHRSQPGLRSPAVDDDAARGDASQALAPEGGYTYVPVNPYRTYDSRAYATGFLPGGYEDYFDVLTDVDGVQMIPAEAVAVTYNLAIVGTVGSGFLAVYPADINWPGNASINWTASDTILSNGGTVAIGTYDGPGQLAVYAGPAGFAIGTDYVIDITGFYF